MHHCRNGSCLCAGLHLESVASRLREVFVIVFTPLFPGHFSNTVPSSGLPSTEKTLWNWSESRSRLLMWLRVWSTWDTKKAWDTWIQSAWGTGISSLSSTATCVIRENRGVDASWVHCQEGQTVDTGYGKEDSNSLWEKNKSALLRMVFYPGDKPQLDKAFVIWLNFDVVSTLMSTLIWVDSDVQKSLPT